MTREEALQWLTNEKWKNANNKYKKEWNEAFEMAIEALSEPINCIKCKHYYETEDDTDVHGHCRMDTAHTNLISRADALRELNGACSNWKDDCKVAEIINALPSSDAVQGEWIEKYNGNGWNDFWDYTCSNCGKKYERADAVLYHANYCPNCGAKMKGGAE